MATTTVEEDRLSPEPWHESVGELVTEFIQKSHYSHISVDDDLSSRVMDRYIEALDGNDGCSQCHTDPDAPKTRATTTPCLDCHQTHSETMTGDDCTTCHNTHGSIFPDLLTYQEPFLCLQCHTGHTDFTNPGSPSSGFKQAFYTKCTNCHSQIHGTDTRGPHPGSGFTQ